MANSYIELRHKALVLRDNGGYCLGLGECNPVIFEEFVEFLFDGFQPAEEGAGPVIWEPFAGHSGKSKAQDYAFKNGVTLVSHDIAPSDPSVIRADSTLVGPGIPVGGVFMHPPYYGSPFTRLPGELSMEMRFEAYLGRIRQTVFLAKQGRGGLMCVVCRKYLCDRVAVDLPQAFCQLLEAEHYRLLEVWLSEPDVVLLMEKT